MESSSGKHKGKRTSATEVRKRLRYVLYEAALSVVARVPEFRAVHDYYTHRRKNPLKKDAVSDDSDFTQLIRLFYAILKSVPKYRWWFESYFRRIFAAIRLKAV